MPEHSRAPSTSLQTALTAGILAFGAALRLREYFHNRSLWLDEASLAMNILERSPQEFMRPLASHQAAPPAFLLAQKGIVALAGISELALRMLPLLAGLAALVLFTLTARRLLGNAAGAAAAAMFAFSPWLVRYSAEMKQYSIEVLVTVVLVALSLPLIREPFQLRRLLAIAVVGAVAVWSAFPAIFLLAGFGIVIFCRALAARDQSRIVLIGVVGAAWVASFGALYVLLLRAINADPFLRESWQLHTGFPPAPILSAATVEWYHDTLFNFFREPGGLDASAVALLLAIIGGWHLWTSDRWVLRLLGAPIGVALLASAARTYPFTDRLGLYLTPLLYLVIAHGLARLYRANRFIGAAAGAILLISPILQSAGRAITPKDREELRTVLRHVQRVRAPEDGIIVYYHAVNAFRYYTLRGDIAPAPFEVIGKRDERPDWQWNAVRQLSTHTIPGRKSWLIISHSHTGDGVDEGRLLIRAAETAHIVLDSVQAIGATAFLLGPRPPAAGDIVH